VGRVDDENRSDLVGDIPEHLEVPRPRIGGRSADDRLGTLPYGDVAHFVVVDELIGLTHSVRHDIEHLAREVDRRSMSEVPSVSELHAHEGVTRLEKGKVGRGIGLGPRVRLHVHVLGAEELLGPLDGEFLDDVDELAAPVVAPARVTLGVFVRQRGA
jgi:hypothetical protein